MGVSKTDFFNLVTKAFGEQLATAYQSAGLGSPKLVEMVIVEDWMNSVLETSAERMAIWTMLTAYREQGQFTFDPDIERNCENCKHLSDFICSKPNKGCFRSIPVLWEPKD